MLAVQSNATYDRGMGSGHGHGAVTASGRQRTRMLIAFVLVASFFIVELVVGLVSGSLALISDAGHMAADVVALGAALVATRIATRADRTGRRSYGSYRAEIFASGFTVLLMLGVSAYVVIEAVGRIGDVVEIDAVPVLLVGALGLSVNLVTLALLRSGSKESLNVKGAYLEVVADAVGSVGVVIAAVLVLATGSGAWDTAIALAIGAFVSVRAVLLGRQVLAVLGQHVPEGLDIDVVAGDLAAVGGVADVHDLHVWTLTSGMNVATAHLVLAEGARAHDVLQAAQQVLNRDYGIEHATLQIEDQPLAACHELSW